MSRGGHADHPPTCLDRKSTLLYHAYVRTCVRTDRRARIGQPMIQLAANPTTTHRVVRPRRYRATSFPGQPAIRIHVARPCRRGRFPATEPAPRTVIKLQPIVSKPRLPYVLRESACGYLECRTAGRRCLAASGREVSLGYQVAYCLGNRHDSCPHFARATGRLRSSRMKKAAYAAAVVVLLSLIVAAVVQAIGTSAPVEIGRAVGLG